MRDSILWFVIPLIVFAAAPALAQVPIANGPGSVRAPALEVRAPAVPAASAGGEPVPDTTDWRRYFPLEVGNEWQYQVEQEQGNIFYFGYMIIGDTTLQNTNYFLLQSCFCNEQDAPSCGSADLIRYDYNNALIIERIEINEVPYLEWWDPIPCRLDADFGAGPIECAAPGTAEYFASGGYGYTYVLSPDTLHNVTFKEFDSVPTVTGMVAGVGKVWRQQTKGPFQLETLMYARIGGKEYGDPYFAFPSADEPSSIAPARAGITALYPNPARERVNVGLRLATAESVTVEVVDVLGRVVNRSERGSYGPGEHLVTLDVSALANGAYVVRAVSSAEAGAVQGFMQKLTLMR